MRQGRNEMNQQPEILQPELPLEQTMEERFKEWIEKRPELYEAFKRAALYRIKHLGKKRIGAKEIVERMRMDRRFNKYNDDPYKINNTYVSLLVRRFIREYPWTIEFIELRRRKA